MSDRSRLRLFILQVLVLSLFVSLMSRLWFLQVLHSSKYVAKQSSTGSVTIGTPAARGRIIDAQGRELATNLSTYVVSVRIQDFPNAKTARSRRVRATVLHKLAGLLQMDEQELSDRTTLCEYKDGKLIEKQLSLKGKCWNGSQYQPIPIARDIDERQAFLIAEHAEDFPGVEATLAPARSYPNGQLAAHLLGYIQPSTDPDAAGQLVGRNGLELQYDDALKGVPGAKTLELNSRGAVTRELESHDPVPGSDLVLSVDLGVQKVAEDALQHAMERARTINDPCKACPTAGQPLKASAGAAIVLEAKTGRVAAMASYPTFDPAKFLKPIIKGSPDERYLFDEKTTPQVSRAYQGQYAPGSTFKHVSTAAAVMEGHGLQDTFTCPGSVQIGSTPKNNYEGVGVPGNISWRTTLIQSCDTVYYQIAQDDWAADDQRIKNRQPPNEFVQSWAARFGFGKNTGIDLPNEVNGAIPTRQWLQELNAKLHPEYCRQAKLVPKESKQGQLFSDLCQNGSSYRPGDQANAAVGQGYVLATPLQLAVSYAALVNGGNLMQPEVAKAIVSPGGIKVAEIVPKVTGTLGLDPTILNYIKDALAAVPKEGTAKCAFGMAPATTDCKDVNFAQFPFDKLDIGGKTGTAQVLNKQDTSWFASFGPVSDPRYVVVVMIEQGGTGGTVAAPAAREIWDGIYGLEGKPAALEAGALPTKLPTVLRDGRIRPLVGVGNPASSSTSAPPAALPAADDPKRRRGRVT
ncbi:MAG: penicillin-binding protein 2 [Actinomycetota bacterium]